MHHIYKTPAIILNSRDMKEADKQLVLLTQDFGLIRAIAQGTRKTESKLRPSIQDYSFTEVALVNGRTGWRLTNAKIDFSISAKIENKKLLKSFAQSLNLIERLVLGESEDGLFEIVIKFAQFYIEYQQQILHTDQIKNLESIFVLNILESLGYVDDNKTPEIVKKEITQKLSIDLINSIEESRRKELNKIINQSIRESGL
jgi:DNA repair protein RecO